MHWKTRKNIVQISLSIGGMQFAPDYVICGKTPRQFNAILLVALSRSNLQKMSNFTGSFNIRFGV